jgi:hypothetical protein
MHEPENTMPQQPVFTGKNKSIAFGNIHGL